MEPSALNSTLAGEAPQPLPHEAAFTIHVLTPSAAGKLAVVLFFNAAAIACAVAGLVTVLPVMAPGLASPEILTEV